MMDPMSLMFYFLATMIVFFALGVVLSANPIFSALFLALTMITLAFVFFMLNAHFIAGVQLIVYAGAVIVMFVMVLMIFDLKHEEQAFTKGRLAGFLKIASAGWICGLIAATVVLSSEMLVSISPQAAAQAKSGVAATKDLAVVLFSQYLFAFEALGLLLLLIAVGVVAVSRIKGGTHARS